MRGSSHSNTHWIFPLLKEGNLLRETHFLLRRDRFSISTILSGRQSCVGSARVTLEIFDGYSLCLGSSVVISVEREEVYRIQLLVEDETKYKREIQKVPTRVKEIK
jgi:hypothetical protein